MDQTAQQPEDFLGWPNAQGFADQEETTVPTPLELHGRIPSYVNCALYRTGPGSYTVPLTKKPGGGEFKIYHWFDGFAQHHKFDITAPSAEFPDGKVVYRSKHAATGLKKRIDDLNGSPNNPSFGYRDPCKNKFQKFFTKFERSSPDDPSTANVSVTVNPNFPSSAAMSGDSGELLLYAKTDANVLMQLNKETLEPEQVSNWTKLYAESHELKDSKDEEAAKIPFQNPLDGPLSASHSCFDAGKEFNFTMKFGRQPTVTLFSIDSTRTFEIYATVPIERPAYLHSFFLSKSYIVLCLWQADFTFGGLSFLWNRNTLDCINKTWNPARKTLWYVVPRDGSARSDASKIKVFESDPFFAFHTINTYEQDDDIYLSIAQCDTHSFLYGLVLDSIKSNTATSSFLPDAPYYARWKLPSVSKTGGFTSTGKSDPAARGAAILDARSDKREANIELPTLNPSVAFKREQYVYGIGTDGVSSFFDRVLKIDTQTMQAIYWTQHGCTPSEPLFFADPQGEKEDDGVLLTVVLDGFKKQSELVILDARDLSVVCRAVVPGNKTVGFGFHGAISPR